MHIGQQLRVSDEIGSLSDAFGQDLGRLTANRAGIVLSYWNRLSVERGDSLVMLVKPSEEY